jgi:alginate O-acetyltransferase complex protein AlgI
MFGFRFLENFSHPYVAQSITEFWRRWHISLSTWFRDYLYVPLGGNRGSALRTYRNLVLVFFLCGLWHGASWSFVVWGLLHGFLLVVERMGLARIMARWPRALRHVWTLFFVMIAWVFFRADSLPQAEGFLRAMFGLSPATGVEHSLALYIDGPTILALVAGAVGSTPVLAFARQHLNARSSRPNDALIGASEVVALSIVLLACSMMLAAGTYNPFIYFRF